jgi:excinuclease UvrABC ATPase subunit
MGNVLLPQTSIGRYARSNQAVPTGRYPYMIRGVLAKVTDSHHRTILKREVKINSNTTDCPRSERG